jgi:ATP-binding cassette subfamily C (CFTR/MRP) protein 4
VHVVWAYVGQQVGRWFGLRLDAMVSTFVFVVSIIALTTRSTNSGGLGSLAVSYSIQLASAFQWSIRNGIDAESYMTSVERLLDYADPNVVPMVRLGVAESRVSC